MSEIFHELHESELQAEIDHHKNEIETEKELIEEHIDNPGTNFIEKEIRKVELDHEEHVLERNEHELQKDEAKLDKAEGKPALEAEDACAKAEEFKKLADQAKEESLLDEDLFETPIQPLK